MKRLFCLLLTAGALPACATHIPPPKPMGNYRPINFPEQMRMQPPEGAIEHTCYVDAKPYLCRVQP